MPLTPVAKARQSCESSDSRNSHASHTPRETLRLKTRNFVHSVRNRFSTETLHGTDRLDGTTSLPASPAKHRWWKSLRTSDSTSRGPVLTIPWVGPAAASVRYGESLHRSSDFANSLGKAYRRKSLPDRLPLMFTASKLDEGNSNCSHPNQHVTESSLSRKVVNGVAPPRLEMLSVVEFGTQNLSSFREISEQAILEVGSKYNEEEKDQEGKTDTPLHGETIRNHQCLIMNPSIDAVMTSADSANSPTEASAPGSEARKHDIPSSHGNSSFAHSSEAPSRLAPDNVQRESLADGISELLRKQRVKIQYPTYGFWGCDGETVEYHNGDQALTSFMLLRQFGGWSTQLLYQEDLSTLYALPAWVVVDRQQFPKSWTSGVWEIFYIGNQATSHLRSATVGEARARLIKQGNSVFNELLAEVERNGGSFSSTTQDDEIEGTESLKGERCSSPQPTSELFKARSGKHVSFSERVQVQTLNDTDTFPVPDTYCTGGDADAIGDESQINEAGSDAHDADEGTKILTEVKDDNRLEAHQYGSKLRRSKTSIQRLRVQDLPRREEDLENMSPIELEDIDMEMAERLGGRPMQMNGSRMEV